MFRLKRHKLNSVKIFRGISPCIIIGLSTCTDTEQNSAHDMAVKNEQPQVFYCEPNRDYSCADIYQPVCATRDNGVRCVTTPCDSTEEVTYPTECAACADERVYSYIAGECPDPKNARVDDKNLIELEPDGANTRSQ